MLKVRARKKSGSFYLDKVIESLEVEQAQARPERKRMTKARACRGILKSLTGLYSELVPGLNTTN